MIVDVDNAPRNASREQSLGKITEAALKLVKGGYLLAEDLPGVIKRAVQHWDYVVNGQGRIGRNR